MEVERDHSSVSQQRDNVRIHILKEGQFHWQVSDVEKMESLSALFAVTSPFSRPGYRKMILSYGLPPNLRLT